jgi:hypothetical protein
VKQEKILKNKNFKTFIYEFFLYFHNSYFDIIKTKRRKVINRGKCYKKIKNSEKIKISLKKKES